MNSMVKKTVIYSLVGVMQIGFGVAVTEASPLPAGNWQPQTIQMDHRHDHDRERQREHDRREREENRRHEREMRRRDHESEREWHARQEREKERHEQALREIAALVIGIVIGNAN
ncbi:hypothetical protein [Propionispora vibrioides]|jgi:hypothetical protein|uniref:Uncharacterized protein n=1 Tax=Propionispora vibrioides TaxID=112903 RepID=A0A1H8Y1Q7_9FIRM|nr:hypothetical protein [Propionispora vibrioides]SEP45977.1 hypothetical protein SAMN04490178_13719 [Propionispora vibrioides]